VRSSRNAAYWRVVSIIRLQLVDAPYSKASRSARSNGTPPEPACRGIESANPEFYLCPLRFDRRRGNHHSCRASGLPILMDTFVTHQFPVVTSRRSEAASVGEQRVRLAATCLRTPRTRDWPTRIGVGLHPGVASETPPQSGRPWPRARDRSRPNDFDGIPRNETIRSTGHFRTRSWRLVERARAPVASSIGVHAAAKKSINQVRASADQLLDALTSFQTALMGPERSSAPNALKARTPTRPRTSRNGGPPCSARSSNYASKKEINGGNPPVPSNDESSGVAGAHQGGRYPLDPPALPILGPAIG